MERSKHYVVQSPQNSKAILDANQHSISYTLSRNQAIIVEYKEDSNTDMFQVNPHSSTTSFSFFIFHFSLSLLTFFLFSYLSLPSNTFQRKLHAYCMRLKANIVSNYILCANKIIILAQPQKHVSKSDVYLCFRLAVRPSHRSILWSWIHCPATKRMSK